MLQGRRVLLCVTGGVAAYKVEEVKPGEAPAAYVQRVTALKLDAALESFDHPAIHRLFHWDLSRGVEVEIFSRPLPD